jgi:hypothetical protein
MAQPDVLVLVASSGQETYPPVSRTLHEKMLYVEALKRGFESAGACVSLRACSCITSTAVHDGGARRRAAAFVWVSAVMGEERESDDTVVGFPLAGSPPATAS